MSAVLTNPLSVPFLITPFLSPKSHLISKHETYIHPPHPSSHKGLHTHTHTHTQQGRKYFYMLSSPS